MESFESLPDGFSEGVEDADVFSDEPFSPPDFSEESLELEDLSAFAALSPREETAFDIWGTGLTREMEVERAPCLLSTFPWACARIVTRRSPMRHCSPGRPEGPH